MCRSPTSRSRLARHRPWPPRASIRPMTSTARPTTSARWWRSSCAGRSGSPPRERGAPSPASDSRTPWWPEGGGVKIRVIVNGSARELEIDAHALLLDVLRDGLDLKGAKRSCDMQVCGACTVLVDGLAVSACTYLALEADGRSVLTVEGLADGESLHPLQRAFIDAGAVQCGFCTSGMLLTARPMLAQNPKTTRRYGLAYLRGSLCRCTGYRKIVDAVLAAAENAQ